MREEAKRRAELYQALADGKTLQVREVINGGDERWVNVESHGISMLLIERGSKDTRIKPEPKKAWYRVVLFKNGTTTAESEHEEKRWSECNSNFICWLTDRIEYELPEGE